MLPNFFSKPLIVLTLLSAFSCQQEVAERLAAHSTVGLLPTSSFVTAIRQTAVIQAAEAPASSFPTLASAPSEPSSSPLALSPSLRAVNDDKGKAKELAEKSLTTQEKAQLLKRGYRPRMPGIWAQCDSYYAVSSSYLPLSLFFFLFFLFLSSLLPISIFFSLYIYIKGLKKRRERNKQRLKSRKICPNRLPCGQLGSIRSRSGTYQMTGSRQTCAQSSSANAEEGRPGGAIPLQQTMEEGQISASLRLYLCIMIVWRRQSSRRAAPPSSVVVVNLARGKVLPRHTYLSSTVRYG